MSFKWTFPGGKIESNITSIVLANNTSKTTKLTVPTGKIWLLYWISLTNPDDVVRDVIIMLYEETALTNVLTPLFAKAAMDASAAVRYVWPNAHVSGYLSNPGYPLILKADQTIAVTWAAGGASAGGTDADGLIAQIREIDAP